MTDASYWKRYGNLQYVKHQIIRNYLNGWLPKLTLGKWGNPRVIYCDTHAGRGVHKGGDLGSPLVALSTVLDHSGINEFENSEIRFFFIEHDAENLKSLAKELEAFQPLPKNVKVDCVEGDCFKVLDEILSDLEKKGASMAPGFFFCDPFGFKVPGELLRRLMKYRGVEIFINVIWRELDMAIALGRNGNEAMAKLLDLIFAGLDWTVINSNDFNERAEECVQLLRQMVGADWATYIRMRGRNDQTRYFLLHLTNHPSGREYMKECVWKSCPDGGYYARQRDNPDQQMLITPEPDLGPVEAWVIGKLGEGPKRWQSLLEMTRDELWLPKHTNSVIRQLRKDGAITPTAYEGKFLPSSNPLLSLNQ